MGKIVKLTEGDLINLIKRALSEQKLNEGSGMGMGMSPEAMQDLSAFHNMGKKSKKIKRPIFMYEDDDEQMETEMTEACWKGYTKKGMKTMYGKKYPNCVKNEALEEDEYGSVEETDFVVGDLLTEAEYQGRKVSLSKPFLTPDGPKKRSVYVKNEKGNVVKVNFGDPNMRIKKNSPSHRKSFRARHNCDNPGPKYKSRYWSCRQW